MIVSLVLFLLFGALSDRPATAKCDLSRPLGLLTHFVQSIVAHILGLSARLIVAPQLIVCHGKSRLLVPWAHSGNLPLRDLPENLLRLEVGRQRHRLHILTLVLAEEVLAFVLLSWMKSAALTARA